MATTNGDTPIGASAPTGTTFMGLIPTNHAARTVRVTVRAVTRSTPWGGELWTIEPRTVNASPQLVKDLLAAGQKGQLLVSWPEDYVTPDGIRPAEHKLDEAAAANMSSADRVAAAEQLAKRNGERAVAVDLQLRAATSRHEGEVAHLRVEVATAQAMAMTTAAGMTKAEQDKAAAVEALETATRGYGTEIRVIRERTKAEIDTAKAEAQGEVEKAYQANEQMQSAHLRELEEVRTTAAAEIDAAKLRNAAELNRLGGSNEHASVIYAKEMETVRVKALADVTEVKAATKVELDKALATIAALTADKSALSTSVDGLKAELSIAKSATAPASSPTAEAPPKKKG